MVIASRYRLFRLWGVPMSLTAGEIVERIRPGTDARKGVERIKHWQRLGLIEPASGQGGTGNRYRYPELMAVDAAILWAISDAGASVQAIGGDLRAALAVARPAVVDWDRAGRRGSLFLVLSSIAGRPLSALVSEVSKGAPKVDPGAEASMVINLSQACARLPRGILQEAEIADRVEMRIEGRSAKRRGTASRTGTRRRKR
jgi:hypothetical protein